MTYVFDMTWFEKIRERREALGLSQAELAKRADISQAAINKIESGKVARSRFMPRLAKILSIPLVELDTDFDADLIRKRMPPMEVENRLFDGTYLDDQQGNTPVYQFNPGQENEMWLLNEPSGSIDRPPFLDKYGNDVIAVIINTNVMAPELHNGDIVFVSDALSTLVGSINIFISKHYKTPRSRLCKIGRVIATNSNQWAIQTLSVSKRSEDTEVLKTDDWFEGLRVIANYYANWDQRRPAPPT